MKIDENRLKRQIEFGDKFINHIKEGYKGGAGEFPTGFGKTYAACLIMKRFNSSKKINIVVPRVFLVDQWKIDLDNAKIYNSSTFVVNSYVKEKRKCDFLILDECHKYSNEKAELFSSVIENTECSYILALSAKFTKKQLDFLEEKGIKLIDSVSLSEAVKNKWVSEYVEYNLGLSLNSEENEKYTEQSKLVNHYMKFFGSDLHVGLKCLTDKSFRDGFCEENGLTNQEVGKNASKLQASISSRKAIVYGGKAKIEIIKEITEKFPIKTILFSETIKYCQSVQKTIKDVSTIYHSKLKANEKEKALEIIKLIGKIKVILTARALDEGLDVKDIDCAIIASGTSSELQHIQRKGRALRFIVGKLALIINLYYKGTVDEQWLKKRQRGQLPARWINSLDEIEYEFKLKEEVNDI